ncbi:hypothetical protein ACFV14_27135 [Streptomyces zaomyceticus]
MVLRSHRGSPRSPSAASEQLTTIAAFLMALNAEPAAGHETPNPVT